MAAAGVAAGAGAGAATGPRAGAGAGASGWQGRDDWSAHTAVQFPEAIAFSVIASTAVQLLQTDSDVDAKLSVTH